MFRDDYRDPSDKRAKLGLAQSYSALAFDPLKTYAHGLKASIYFEDAEFKKSLEAADTGLQIDPHNELCLNHRSMALLKLDRKEEHLDADQQAAKIKCWMHL